VADTLAGFPPASNPTAESRQDTPRLFSRVEANRDNVVTREQSAFDEAESRRVAALRSADLGDLAAGPPPMATPHKPLTEETAMPPVLPLAAPQPASEPPAAAPAEGRPSRSVFPIPVTRHPAPAPATSTPARESPRPILLRPGLDMRSGLDATIPDPAAPTPMVGPAPESRPVVPSRRAISAPVYAALGLFTAAVVAFIFFRSVTTSEPTALTVRTVVPASGSVYRWFDAVGTVKPGGERTLTFSSAGKVASVLPPGSRFHPGDVIAELEGARRFKSEVAHHNDRLSHYEKLLETARASGDRPEARQAEIKVVEKKRLAAEAQAKLTREQVVATGPGEIAEAAVAVGALVKPGAAAARTKGTDWRAELELSHDDADRLRQLGFCHVEIDGKPLDCSLAAEGGDETHVAVELPADPAVAAGKPVRVARARFDGVFLLPASALVPSKGPDHRVFVAKDGHAESTAVILADQTPTEIVVSQGLEAGSAVILDPPPQLGPRAAIRVSDRR
jgi:multidrug efflux pump subunit AcrA (membrane-fusion protein)